MRRALSLRCGGGKQCDENRADAEPRRLRAAGQWAWAPCSKAPQSDLATHHWGCQIRRRYYITSRRSYILERAHANESHWYRATKIFGRMCHHCNKSPNTRINQSFFWQTRSQDTKLKA
jgi:hypothetical protein